MTPHGFLSFFFRVWDIHKTHPDGTKELYFRRYYLFSCSRFQLLLHCLYKSDSEGQPLHDHPWDFTTLMLRNGYSELLPPQRPGWPREVRHTRPGQIRRNRAEWIHKVIVQPNKPAWTLVLTGPTRREWGFHAAHGWMTNKAYFASRRNEHDPLDNF